MAPFLENKGARNNVKLSADQSWMQIYLQINSFFNSLYLDYCGLSLLTEFTTRSSFSTMLLFTSQDYSWDQSLDFSVLGLSVLFALRLGLQFSPSVLGYNIIDGVYHHVRLFPEKV